MSRLSVVLCLFVMGVVCPVAMGQGLLFTAEVSDDQGVVTPIEGLLEIAIDDIVWDYKTLQSPLSEPRHNLTKAAGQGYRLYGPGQAHWGNAKFTCTLGGSKELQAWWGEAAKGKNIRKNITVTLYKSNKQPGRSYTLNECFPTQWSSVNFDTSSTVQTETLVVSVGGIEFGDAESKPRSGEGLLLNVDGEKSHWNMMLDGEPQKIQTDAQANSKFKTNSPGHKTVGEITLRGAMTDGRKALCDWINETVDGKPWKRMLTITELLSVDGGVKDGKQYIYHDCFPVRYVFPRMSVTNTTGNVMEEVAIKPIRVELK